MKTDILEKLEKLLKSDNILDAQKEFKVLSAQYKDVSSKTTTTSAGSSDKPSSEEGQKEIPPVVFSILLDEQQSDEASISEEIDSNRMDQSSETNAHVKVDEISDVKGDSEALPAEQVGKDADLKTVESKSEETPTPLTDGSEDSSSSFDTRDSITELQATEQSVNKPEESVQNSKTVMRASGEQDNSQETAQDSDSAQVAAGTESNPDGMGNTGSSVINNQNQDFETAAHEEDESDAKFLDLSKQFKEKLDKAKTEKKQIEQNTLDKAKKLLADLQKLVENEENIGKAFAGFNEIRDQWKALPRVGNEAYRELNAEYNRYNELFFYNINIYKELKELDLKHNLELKHAVLADQKKLQDTNDIRLLEVEVRLNQDRWNEIGPTFKEDWNKLKDEFWEATRSIYKKIQDSYNLQRAEQEQNLIKKAALLDHLKGLTENMPDSHRDWSRISDDIKVKQQEWKTIGRVPREKAKKLLKQYRSVCDAFFETKRNWYNEANKADDANKAAKMQLIEKAEAANTSENWKETSQMLIQLQKDWKELGSAGRRDENQLWRRFRKACDVFFENRTANRNLENKEQKENLVLKHQILKNIAAWQPGESRTENVDQLKSFGEQWRVIGHVPFKEKDKVNTSFKSIMDEKYGLLKIDKKEKEKIRFEERLEDIKDSDQNDRLMKREHDTIRSQISRQEAEVILLENNIGFFASSKGAEKLKQDVEKKIEKARAEIDTLKGRLAQLRNV